MKKHFFLCSIILCCFYFSDCQEKRALLIGINKYAPPENYKATTTFGRIEFPNLRGSRNDVLSIQSLITSKFSFDIIDTLIDNLATRENILKAINHLLTESKAGDIAFIFYAGHGSQVRNSLSDEFDKKDETIVPSDIWKEGVEDIRDKELSKLFNRFVGKGIKLTVILDCCHSGSMSRGFTTLPSRFRFIADANYDSKDASNLQAPESRPGNNFMILSASQDAEPAEEQKDDNNVEHGAFTLALTDALNQLSVNASAQNIFTSLRAVLKSNGKNQEPVIAGSKERIEQTLFGIGNGILNDKQIVAVSGIMKNSNKVFLQGGFATGIYKETELAKMNGNDTAAIVKIDSVLGINLSRGIVIKGDINQIKTGNFLEIINWVSSKAPLIKIYIPPTDFSYEQVLKFAETDKQLKQSNKIKWMNNLEKNDPYSSIYFDEKNWFINAGNKNKISFKNFTLLNILNQLIKDSSVYVELPLNIALANVLKETLVKRRSILLVNNPADANYTIYGTINNKGVPCYGLRRLQTSAKDSLESMPVQTKYFSLTENSNNAFQFIADSINEYVMRLAKIRGWLHLVSPLNAKNNFPFHLELFDINKKKAIDNQYKINDSINMHLIADSGFVYAAKKYLYVFAIDKYGNMALLYPEDGNQQNQFPKYDVNKTVFKDVQLGDAWKIPEPTGTDNYFLLATEDAIPNPFSVFFQKGVRGINTLTPMEELLNLGNQTSRGVLSSLPRTWSLKKLSVKCVY